MKGLTERQTKVLSFLSEFIEAHKYPPTIREVSERFSISVKGAYDHVKALEKKGYIRCTTNHSRAIEIIKKEDSPKERVVHVPILGRVAAGTPLLADENLDGVIGVPTNYLRNPGTYFALKVQGDSMTGAGIMDGDTAIIQQQTMASNGEIVVAMVDEAFTLKRFFREKNRVRLQAENPAYKNIYTTNVRVLGRLAYVIRSYV